MDAGETAAVVVAVISVLALAVLVVAAASLVRTMKALRAAVEEVRSEALPVLTELRGTVASGAGLERVDGHLDTTEVVSERADSASRLAVIAVANPIIKVAAAATGAGRVARRLAHRDDRAPVERRRALPPARGR
jgi:hypothetical protein